MKKKEMTKHEKEKRKKPNIYEEQKKKLTNVIYVKREQKEKICVKDERVNFPMRLN